MSVAGVMVLIALTLGVLTFVTWPLLTQPAAPMGTRPSEDDQSAAAQQLAALQNKYDQLLVTVRDLDFDFQTGKLAAEDHRQQRAALMVNAADLLRQIDNQKANVAEAAVTERRISRAAAQQAEIAIAAQRTHTKSPKI
jgi:hypothetical protein